MAINRTFKKGIENKTFQVSGSFLRSGYTAACSDWRDRIAKEIPDAFEHLWPSVVAGKWYHNTQTDCVFYVNSNEVSDHGTLASASGFDSSNDWFYRSNEVQVPLNERNLVQLKAITSYEGLAARLKIVAKKLGYCFENSIDPIFRSSKGHNKETFNGEWSFAGGKLFTAPLGGGGVCIMQDGIWINKIETIGVTIKEFKKIFGTNAVLIQD